MQFERGSLVKARRNIGDPDEQVPYIYAGDELRVLGHLTNKDGKLLYRVETHRCLIMLVDPVDVTTPKEFEDAVLSAKIEEAFREGYSRGHSRGVNCGRLYGRDDQYSVLIQVETRSYLKELKDESGS